MSKDLDGARALVTGGTKGIGAATARTLQDRGARVVIAGRTAPDSPVGDALFVPADLADPDAPAALAETTLDALGGLDVLVEAAGTQVTHTSVSEFTDDDWQAELQIHLMAAVRLDRALLPALGDSAGAIVHVGSIVARLPEPAVLAYATAKAALAVYSKGLSREVGARGVRVNTVLPGFTATRMMTDRVAAMASEHGQSVEDFQASLMQQTGVSLGRAASPDEVARTIAWLVSPDASYVTGTTVAVDGGVFPSVF